MHFLTIVGAKYLIYVLLLIAGIFFLQMDRPVKYQMARFALFSLPVTFAVAKLGSYFFYDPRPFVSGHFIPLIAHAADNGFPSDHALLAFAVAALVFHIEKKFGTVLYVLALAIGVSRVAAGVHSFIDIFGSFVICVVVAVAVSLGEKALVKMPRDETSR